MVSMNVLKMYLSLYTLLRSHLFVNCCIRRYSLYTNSQVNQELDQSYVSPSGRKLTRNINQHPTKYSQERQQADTQSSSTRKLERSGESASSASSRQLERGEDIAIGRSKMEFHNMQIFDHRYLEKVSKKVRKILNFAEEAPVLGVEALKTNVLMWRLFMSTTMKAAIHLGPNYVENLEVFRNTNFEELQNLIDITQKLIKVEADDNEPGFHCLDKFFDCEKSDCVEKPVDTQSTLSNRLVK